jgi:hypothetical protein
MRRSRVRAKNSREQTPPSGASQELGPVAQAMQTRQVETVTPCDEVLFGQRFRVLYFSPESRPSSGYGSERQQRRSRKPLPWRKKLKPTSVEQHD